MSVASACAATASIGAHVEDHRQGDVAEPLPTTSPAHNGPRWVGASGGCAYCGKPGDAPQRDCVLPVSRGGRYTLDNVVPACRACNASKCDGEVTAWLRRKRYDERAFLTRLPPLNRRCPDGEAARIGRGAGGCG